MSITTKSTVFIPISIKMQAPSTFLTPKNSMKITVVCPIFTVAMDVFRTSRGNMGGVCGKQLLVWKFELDAVGFLKTKFTGE
jgi:hypothetical protein